MMIGFLFYPDDLNQIANYLSLLVNTLLEFRLVIICMKINVLMIVY